MQDHAGCNIMNAPQEMGQHSVGCTQGSSGLATYPHLHAGLEASPTDIGIVSDMQGIGAIASMGAYVMNRGSDRMQVNLSLLPFIPCGDGPDEYRKCPRPNSQSRDPPFTIPEQRTALKIRLK